MDGLRNLIKRVIRHYNNIELEPRKDDEEITRITFYMNGLYYRTVEIERNKNYQWRVKIIPLNIIRIVDDIGVVDIIEAIEKYSTARDYTWRDIALFKKKYPEGTRVRLIKMYDYLKTIPSGTEGIVDHVDNAGGIHVKWKDEMEHVLLVGIDEFELI